MRLARIILGLVVAALGVPAGAVAQPCPVNVPHVDGQWATLPYLMPINPISATLMRNGRVLVVAGSENDHYNDKQSFRYAVWDPAVATQDAVDVQGIHYDVFCSGTAVLSDGRPLVVGGTSDYTFTGDSRASIFDPVTGTFLQTQGMVDGRWYATATALGDGRIMAFSGIRSNGLSNNNTVEMYDLRTAGAPWTAPASAPFTPPLYPRMALLPSGKVFFTGQGSSRRPNSWLFDPGPRTWQISAPTTSNRSYGSAVLLPLYPPSYTPKVMNFGGNGSATTELIDFSAAIPLWTPGPSMSAGRIECNAITLPDGTVLALGGSAVDETPDAPGKHADLYDPASNSFSSGGTASYSRLYHSVALLLPDATVATLGSNPSSGYEPSIEIYTPAYLFDENDQPITTGRPEITGVTPGPLGYGVPFAVSYTSSSAISAAVLVRPGSATHAGDMEQRLVGLCGPAPQPPCTGTGTLTLVTPPNGNLAPPGYYMLFLLDSDGVPSHAQFVQLSPYATTPPAGTITSPASDQTIAPGGSVFFEGAEGAAQYSWVFPGGTPGSSSARVPGNVTFSAPGTHVSSLTVIDAAGNSDPSPPTRTITVTPPQPNFDIEVTPPWWSIVPGQSVPFTVMVTPLSGFTGTVTLTLQIENGFPTGVSSSAFTPPTITGGVGSSTFSINTTASARPWALSLTVKGTSGSLVHSASTSLLINLAPPADLIATPGSTQVGLSWPPALGATGYHVKRSLVGGGPYVGIACTAGTSFTDAGLTNGTAYHYVVASTFGAGPNAGGEGTNSIEASATPAVSPPPAPTGLVATAATGQVDLTWSAAPGAGSYKVKRATTSGGPYDTIATPFTTAHVDQTVEGGTTYFYVVSGVNSGGEGPDSAEATATPPTTTTSSTTTSTTSSTTTSTSTSTSSSTTEAPTTSTSTSTTESTSTSTSTSSTSSSTTEAPTTSTSTSTTESTSTSTSTSSTSSTTSSSSSTSTSSSSTTSSSTTTSSTSSTSTSSSSTSTTSSTSSSTSTSSTSSTSTSSSSTSTQSTSSSTSSTTSTSSSSSSTSTSSTSTSSSSSSTSTSTSSSTTRSTTSSTSSTTSTTSSSSSTSTSSTSTSSSSSSTSTSSSSTTTSSTTSSSSSTSSSSTTSTSTSTTSSTTTLAAVQHAPDCTNAVAAPGTIAPVDDRFTPVAIAGLADVDGDPIAVSVTSIGQDEPLRYETCPDGVGVGSATAELRAARRDHRRRAYRVTFRAEDGRGGQCTGSVVACVPGTDVPELACIGDATTLDSTAPGCTGVCAVACGVERTLGHARCSGDTVPEKLARSIEKARRRMVHAATGARAGKWIRGAIKSMDRAERIAARAKKAGSISPLCADAISQTLSQARAAAEPIGQSGVRRETSADLRPPDTRWCLDCG